MAPIPSTPFPDATLKAFINHGTAKATLTEGVDEAQAQLAETAKLDIDVETLATRLQEDGLKQFEDAFAKLLCSIGLSGLNGRPRNLNHFEKSQAV